VSPKARKAFFSEEKNEKTFSHGSAENPRMIRTQPPHPVQALPPLASLHA
jgi:hypothetical protein